MEARKAIGVVRVSRVGERSGDSFASPADQAARIQMECEHNGLELLAVHEELDVSGGSALAKRPGLLRAVEAVEAREADVIVVAYFDRLARELTVQTEIVKRVEGAGGAVLAVDAGAVTHATAAQWLSGTLLGAFSEYQRRTTAERVGEAQKRAVARGVLPYANVPPGYVRNEDRTLRVDPLTAPAVRQAFEMRARGVGNKEIRAHLAANGIERSSHGVQTLLRSRVVLGEIHFGALANLEAHEPIVARDLWRAVQRIRIPRGRPGKSDRLLARLGVLRCGTCGAKMIVGSTSQSQRRYVFYRCPTLGDCPRRMTILANIAEDHVSAVVCDLIAHEQGRASAETEARKIVAGRDKAQEELSAALRVLEGLEDEEGARERLLELRQARDNAQDAVDQLGGEGATLAIGAGDWEHLNLDERRALIRAVVERVDVGPGRGVERLTVVPFGK